MYEPVWTGLIFLCCLIIFGIYKWALDEYRKRHPKPIEAKKSNKPIDLQGVRLSRQRVKCAIENCDYRIDGVCTCNDIDLYEIVRMDYGGYGMYCKSFKCGSIIDKQT